MTFVCTDYWFLRMCSGASEMPFNKCLVVGCTITWCVKTEHHFISTNCTFSERVLVLNKHEDSFHRDMTCINGQSDTKNLKPPHSLRTPGSG